MKTAGTKDTESFELKFLYFNHKDQRWQAECRIGEATVVLASAAGMEKWVVKGNAGVEVPPELSRHLSTITRDALADYQPLKEYKQAVGKYPTGVIQ
jgi:hypothetical protein